jgi:RND family efflux transporter MFP subunit
VKPHLSALVLLAGLAACKPAPEAAKAAATPTPAVAADLKLAAATPTTARPRVEVTGSVEPIQSVQLGFDVGGRTAKLLVERGERVRAGQPVAELNRDMARAQLAQAEAARNAAKAQADAAASGLDRATRLGDALSTQQMSDARSGAAGAQAMFEQANAAVKLAKTNLDWHTLRSPIDGVVTGSPDNAGILVGPGTPMFMIEDLSALRLKGSIPESEGWVTAGQIATATVGGVELTGRVDRVLPSLDPMTRRIPVEIVFTTPPDAVRAHAFARVTIEGAEAEGAFEVPREALVTRGTFAVVVKNGSTEPRVVPVTVVGESETMVKVRGEITSGDQVVVSPPAGYAQE